MDWVKERYQRAAGSARLAFRAGDAHLRRARAARASIGSIPIRRPSSRRNEDQGVIFAHVDLGAQRHAAAEALLCAIRSTRSSPSIRRRRASSRSITPGHHLRRHRADAVRTSARSTAEQLQPTLQQELATPCRASVSSPSSRRRCRARTVCRFSSWCRAPTAFDKMNDISRDFLSKALATRQVHVPRHAI